MGAFIVVVIDPLVQVDLQLLDGLIDLLAEGDLIKLLQAGRWKSPTPLRARLSIAGRIRGHYGRN